MAAVEGCTAVCEAVWHDCEAIVSWFLSLGCIKLRIVCFVGIARY